jgi:hypothetical protein
LQNTFHHLIWLLIIKLTKEDLSIEIGHRYDGDLPQKDFTKKLKEVINETKDRPVCHSYGNDIAVRAAQYMVGGEHENHRSEKLHEMPSEFR